MAVELDGVDYRFVSADDHVLEHPDVWTDRLSARWGDRIPRLVDDGAGGQQWLVDGTPVPLGAAGSLTAAVPDGGPPPRRWEDVPDSAYRPDARLAAMDADGVDASVLYPTVAGLAGQGFGAIDDPELELACVRAYNDWLVEEWAAVSPRFVPQCIVPIYPVEAAVAELERAVSAGHRGLVYPALPMLLRDGPDLTDPGFGRLWRACVDLGVPVAFHSGAATALQATAHESLTGPRAEAFDTMNRSFSSALVLANLLLSQVLVPYPELQVVLGDNSVGWGTFSLETMDYLVGVDKLNVDAYPLLPSEVFGRQCYLVGGHEDMTDGESGMVPPEQVLWASNFPLANSVWPATAASVAHSLRNSSPADRQRILAGNAASLYRL